MPHMAIVVDDSMLIRHTVCRYFEQRGFVVESACNGLEALDMVSRVTPDILVTDLVMPGMDGSQLISAVRARPETAAIPIIVVAGRTEGTDPARETRANAVIYKDIDILEQLDAALSHALPELVHD